MPVSEIKAGNEGVRADRLSRHRARTVRRRGARHLAPVSAASRSGAHQDVAPATRGRQGGRGDERKPGLHQRPDDRRLRLWLAVRRPSPSRGSRPSSRCSTSWRAPSPSSGPLPGVLTGPRPPEKRASLGGDGERGDAFAGSAGCVRYREHSRQLATRRVRSAERIERRAGAPAGAGLHADSAGRAQRGGVQGGARSAQAAGSRPGAGGRRGDTTDPDAPTRFVDGGAIGVELVRGDVSAMGLGTVTRVEGDKLVAFGHPMLDGGIESLPTAIGKVHWILASQNRSFKLGEAARSLGALVNDRQAAIVVDSKARRRRFPVTSTSRASTARPSDLEHGGRPRQFMSPSFTAMAIGQRHRGDDLRAPRHDAGAPSARSRSPATAPSDSWTSASGRRQPPGRRRLERSARCARWARSSTTPGRPPTSRGRHQAPIRFARDTLGLRGAKVLDRDSTPVSPRASSYISSRSRGAEVAQDHRGAASPASSPGASSRSSSRPASEAPELPGPPKLRRAHRQPPAPDATQSESVVAHQLAGTGGRLPRQGRLAPPPRALDMLRPAQRYRSARALRLVGAHRHPDPAAPRRQRPRTRARPPRP